MMRPERSPTGDRRLAVYMMGFIAVIAVVADFVLLARGADPPGGLLAVAGGCVGALATLVTAAVPPAAQPEPELPYIAPKEHPSE